MAGVLRRDIVERLKLLRPGFIRTPGGSYILGSGPRTQYDWKNTVGPPAARPGHYNSNCEPPRLVGSGFKNAQQYRCGQGGTG